MSPRLLAFYAFWILPAVLQLVVAIRMHWIGLHRRLGVFFAYTIFCIVQCGVQFGLYYEYGWTSKTYFVAYWLMVIVANIFAIAVIHEIYAEFLRRYDALHALSGVLFRWACVILVLIAAISAAASPAADADRIMAGILVLDRGAMFVQLGLLLLLFGLASFLALKWRHYIFGIAVGLCLFTSVDVLALTMRTHFGLLAGPTFSLVKSAAYTCCVIVWVVYLLRRESVRIATPEIPNFQLAQWNAALAQFLNR